MTDGWRLAARNLRRNRRRNLATGLAVALGFAGLVILGAYVTRVEAFLRTNAVYLQHGGHVAIYHTDGLDKAVAKPSRFSLTPADQNAIRRIMAADPRVAFVAGYLKGVGLAGNGCRSIPFVALGIDPAVQRRILAEPDVTRFSANLAKTVRGRQLFEYTNVEGAVGLAAGLAGLLGKTRVHDDFVPGAAIAPLPDCAASTAVAAFRADANVQLAGKAFDGSVTAMDADVVNIFHTPSTDTDDQALETSLTTLQALYDTDDVTYMAVFLRDHRDTSRVASDVAARLRQAHVAAEVYEFSDGRVSPFYVGSMAFIGAMASFIVVIVAAVVILGVMNSTTLTVYERSRELGTLRALGYSRRQVSGLVVREIALLAAMGSVAGFVIAHVVALVVRLAGVRISPPGVPGSLLVVLTPPIGVSLGIAALLVPLSLLVAWSVVRRRVRERTSDLLIAVNA